MDLIINFILFIVILVGLLSHRYLSIYYTIGALPYHFGFLLFNLIFHGSLSIALCWSFGLSLGIALAAAALLQIIYGAWLWIFLMPWYLKVWDKATVPPVNQAMYATFGVCTWTTAGLMLANFFTSEYRFILDDSGLSLFQLYIGIAVALGIGHLLRRLIMKDLVKQSVISVSSGQSGKYYGDGDDEL